jgi:ubiquitin carboxyl-terminal hydrolase 5/13
MPEELNLNPFRSMGGVQPNETAMPEVASDIGVGSSSSAVSNVKIVDESLVAELVSMGFSEHGCRKAALEHSDLESAMNWILSHMEDPDFNEPAVESAPGVGSQGRGVDGGTAAAVPDEESVMMIMSMGYTEPQAKAALKATDNNLERCCVKISC